ncbi:MAG: hypothetical protein AABX73_04170 [Nanoarchaeota archaeon]
MKGKEGNVKIGPNIYFYYWTIPLFFVFLLLNYYSRNFRIETLDIDLMISIVSFLFGFLITISFSMLLTRVAALKEALAGETGRLVSLYHLSKNLGEKFHKKVADKIDDYTKKTLGFYTNYELGREEIYGMYDDLDSMEIKNDKQGAIVNSFLYVLGELEPIREKLEYLTGRRMEWSLKFSNYVLGIILVVLLFLNRGDSFTNTLFIILSTIIVFIFLIIEDYDSLRIGDYISNISNSEQIFDMLGRNRYYPQSVLERVRLESGKTYRIGIYNKHKKEEQIFDIVYSQTFDARIKRLLKVLGRKNNN